MVDDVEHVSNIHTTTLFVLFSIKGIGIKYNTHRRKKSLVMKESERKSGFMFWRERFFILELLLCSWRDAMLFFPREIKLK